MKTSSHLLAPDHDRWIILPVRPFHEGKTRLSAALTPKERTVLNAQLFAHSLRVALQVARPQRVLVISRSTAVLERAQVFGVQTLVEPEPGDLNQAVTLGASHAIAAGARQVLSLSSDLPLLDAADLHAMIAAADTNADADTHVDVVIAPDHHGSGTNALLLQPPALIPYAYGASSYFHHTNAAAKAGLRCSVVQREGLALDLDTHEDLDMLRLRGFEIEAIAEVSV